MRTSALLLTLPLLSSSASAEANAQPRSVDGAMVAKNPAPLDTHLVKPRSSWSDGSTDGGNSTTGTNSTLAADCSQCCGLLSQIYGNKTSFPGSTIYEDEQEYWSQQQSETYPVCRFTPTSALDVSGAIKIIVETQCQFAVKSGGHASFAGASNIQGGVTIDLEGMNSLSVSADNLTTYAGSGNRWEDVYQYLDPLNLAVIGGRNGDIGVGGLTLGGGISFFSGYYGWACDNVNNYEVVLANGSIVNASPDTNPDLYFALRGGGNNFGIVTRFDLATFSHGQMWGGMTVYLPDANVSIYQALEQFNINAPTDPSAAVIVAAAAVDGTVIFANDYEYVNATVLPPILSNFTSIPNISDSTRITDLYNLTVELKDTQPDGFRQLFTAITLKNNAQLMSDIFAIWVEEITPLFNVSSFLPSLVFQPITLDIIEKFSKNGGNCLGITADDGPLLLMNMDFQWNDTSKDATVIGTEFDIRDKAIALAQERGLFNEYIYENYASYDQDVISSYGATNKARLIAIQDEYDPTGVFTYLEPGYFKVQ